MSMYGKVRINCDCSIDEATGKECPSMTKQSFAEESNINKIIAKFERTGMIESLNAKEPFYGDVSGIVGYQDSLEKVNKAEELFMAMDANVRDKFQNDPQKMIDFLSNEANLKEAVSLGLCLPRPVVEVPPQG